MNDYVYQDLMEELWARRTDASEANARIQQLLGKSEQLLKERDELRQQVENIKNGFEGGCYLCEVVGEMNKRIQKERDEARREVCEMPPRLYIKQAYEYAYLREWDCYKETP